MDRDHSDFFYPYYQAKLTNLLVPVVNLSKYLTILKWMKMTDSSNCTYSPWMIQFIYIYIYTLPSKI